MMSSRLNANPNTTTTSDDFPYAAMPAMQHHLYDNLDFAAAAAFGQFQEPPLLPLPSNLPMAPPPMPMPMPLQMPMPMPMPGLPDVYPALGLVKREGSGGPDVGGGGGRIGLNLGRRTYFSPGDMLAVDRLLMRSRLGGMFGLGFGGAHHQPPRCQAEGCKADLSGAKHYHRRHKVCEYHAKAAVVVAGGKQQRFCQQCSRFHVLAEFDEAKRSCRKRLAEHNRRRRKPTSVLSKDSTSPSRKSASGTITSSYTADNKTISTTKSTISSNASVMSCMDQSNAKPTLSLGAPQEKKTLNTMLHVQGHQEHFMASCVQSNNNNNNNILSCSSVCSSALPSNGEVSDQNNNNGNMHLFQVDFM